MLASLALCLAATQIQAQQITRKPSDDALAVAEVQRLMKRGETAQALAKAEEIIAAQPREAHGYFLKGRVLAEAGRPQEAMAVFTKMTEDFPEQPEPYNNLAVLYAQQKQYDKARATLEMAIRANPDYAVAHENLGDVYAKLAGLAYDKALRLDSSNKRARAKSSALAPIIDGAGQPLATPTGTAR